MAQGLDLGAHCKVYAAGMATLTVSMLAERTGIPAGTIRYYDRAGLLPPPARTPAGYRQYDEAAAQRLRFIKGAQRLGLRLREVAELLAVRDRGACPCGHARSWSSAASPRSTPRSPAWSSSAASWPASRPAARPTPARTRRAPGPARPSSPLRRRR